jgi:hypothetical protein
VGDDFFGRGILNRKGLAAARVNPFAVDQHLMFFGHECGRGCTERRLVYRNRHRFIGNVGMGQLLAVAIVFANGAPTWPGCQSQQHGGF